MLTTETATPIKVQHIGDGEYAVTRGGNVYVRTSSGIAPRWFNRGDKVSAATICEWRELGSEVEAA